ncbi:unnamed protein product [Phaedon cochleariae]|uniref:Uncharacterized protein n=1 Tax=Phaedon cochleariae TaxID=80249 RepID=A0A9N9SGB9_PHACE|nr:unnamed protein product [Phaedon cochleariae]
MAQLNPLITPFTAVAFAAVHRRHIGCEQLFEPSPTASIGEDADSLWQKPSACYIRIDVAHFIKIYASLVKDLPRHVRVFYLGSIGQLIVSKSLKEAGKILGSILLVSQCETEGYLPCKSEAAKYFLKEIITSSEEIDQAADSEFISETLPQD